MFRNIAHKLKTKKLDQYEIENIEDCLSMFEETFQIKLEDGETEKLNNFDEFSDLIISKIKFENDNLCTSQRAFYQFRKSLKTEKLDITKQISPNSDLKSIFPNKNRRRNIKKVERNLGYKLGVLAPSQITINILFFLFVFSFIGLFFAWKISIVGILISSTGFYLTKFTNRLNKKNVRELLEVNTAQNYFKIRNNKYSINRSEFKTIILEWFSENAGIDKEKLKDGTFA